MALLLGETQEEFAQRRAVESEEVWIKGFKMGESRIRILERTNQFTTYREHFKREVGFFPCGQDFPSPKGGRLFCPACSDMEVDEKVKKRGRKWAFNALDDQGRLNVYKIGSKLKEKFDFQENSRNRVLADQDVIIIRAGKDLDTFYETEWQAPYPLEKVPDELRNIRKAITEAYVKALKAYGVDEYGVTLDDVAPVTEAQVEAEVEQVDEAFYVGPDGPQATKPEPAKEYEVSPDFDPKPYDIDLSTLTAGELRAWLDYRKVEYPKAEPKHRLLSRAREWSPF